MVKHGCLDGPAEEGKGKEGRRGRSEVRVRVSRVVVEGVSGKDQHGGTSEV